MSRDGGTISRDDIEAKFRELQGEIDEAAANVANMAIVVGAAVIATLIVFAYAIGRRRGRRRSAVVEIRAV
ncbi:MAG: hypothetical protein KatS3mg008_0250 [Acidimicrobiales bacterium]|nr:MAG: hypothetical protein KatS3mg008_0250 [Acidimicrobiales bacterium]